MKLKLVNIILVVLSVLTILGTSCSDKNIPEPIIIPPKPAPVDSVFSLVCNKMIKKITEESTLRYYVGTDNWVTTLMGKITDEGAFPDINYDDKKSHNWMSHLYWSSSMIEMYVNPKSKHYQEHGLFTNIVRAYEFWNEKRPKSPEWYMNEIGIPAQISRGILLMRSGREKIPAELEQSLLSYIINTGGDPRKHAGANKADIASWWLLVGYLQVDKERVKIAAEESFYPLQYVTGEGIQYDNSYFQHGNQLYIGGYGHTLLNNVTGMAFNTAETDYVPTDIQLDVMYKFAYNTFFKCMRKNHMFYNVIGRSISRVGATKPNVDDILRRLILIDKAHVAEYEGVANQIKTGNYEGVSDTHTHYYIGDFSLYQSPLYSLGLRFNSERTSKCEWGSNENLKGYFLSEGSMALLIRGDEYEDIFPVWDWCKVPGTTIPQLKKIPLRGEWGQLGESGFAGGVSTGKEGASVYQMTLSKDGVDITANKAWFFENGEILCLGNSISSSMAEPIFTTLNQCLLNGEIYYSSNNTLNTLAAGQQVNDKSVEWIWHDNVGYYFIDKDISVSLSGQAQQGKWKDINSGQPDEIVTKNVFSTWIDHGTEPANGTYAYLIAPNVSLSKMNVSILDKYEILANDKMAQVVRNRNTNTIKAIFYTKGVLNAGEMELSVDNGCALVIKMNEKSCEVFVSDPSQDLSYINVSLNYQGKKFEKRIGLGENKGKTCYENVSL